MLSQICPRPPNVIVPRHSSDTNTPVSASCRYFIRLVYRTACGASAFASTGLRMRANSSYAAALR